MLSRLPGLQSKLKASLSNLVRFYGKNEKKKGCVGRLRLGLGGRETLALSPHS